MYRPEHYPTNRICDCGVIIPVKDKCPVCDSLYEPFSIKDHRKRCAEERLRIEKLRLQRISCGQPIGLKLNNKIVKKQIKKTVKTSHIKKRCLSCGKIIIKDGRYSYCSQQCANTMVYL